MDAGAVIFARLNGATSAGGRVYPLLLPQAPTLPAVTYQQISSVQEHAMGQDSGWVTVRVQVNSWGKSYADARGLANELRDRLARFRGSVGGADVLDVFLDNELETYEPEADARRVIQDYRLFLSAANI